jgi:hypothetical protein
VFGGRRCGLFARVTLIDESDLAGLHLNGFGDPVDLGAIVGVGGCDVESQKMPERVDGQMQLRAFLALGSVVGRARSAFGRRTQGPTVDNGGGRLFDAPRREAKDDVQILGRSLEAARAQPSTRLLIDDLSRRQIIGHPAPWRARLHDVAQAIEYLTQSRNALCAVFRQKGQIRRDKRPFIIGNVRRIGFAGDNHPANLRIYR